MVLPIALEPDVGILTDSWIVQNSLMWGRDVAARVGFQKKCKPTAVALSLLLLIGATGCGGPAAALPPEPRAVTMNTAPTTPVDAQMAAAMSAELKTAIQEFKEPLPAGIQWLKDTPDQLLQPNSTYADGAAEGVIAFYWLCSWEESYLEAVDRSDKNAAASALAEVGKWESLPFAESHFSDPDHAWEKTVLTPAKQGDPTAMRASFDRECMEYKSNNPQ